MDPILTQHAADNGFVTRADFLDIGYTDRDIRESRRAGLLVVIGPGLYSLKANYAPLTPDKQHLIRCVAVARRLEAGVVHHVGRINDDDIVSINGVLATRPERAVWETACGASIEAGLVTMDASLNLKIAKRDALIDAADKFTNWKGGRAARITARLADGRAESPGESRSRYLFWRFHVPRPELQFHVSTRNGVFIARTDFAWIEARHLGEFDGKVKYDGTFGTDGHATVMDEKQREDQARAELYGTSRLVWSDLALSRAKATAARFNRGIEQSKRLYTRDRTVIV